MTKHVPLSRQLRIWAVHNCIFNVGIENYELLLQKLPAISKDWQTEKDKVCIAISEIILEKLKPNKTDCV
jgi:hypothetical protein